MKIIGRDNLDRDYIPETVVASGLSEEDAIKECDRLNNQRNAFSLYFYCVKPEDYQHLTADEIYG